MTANVAFRQHIRKEVQGFVEAMLQNGQVAPTLLHCSSLERFAMRLRALLLASLVIPSAPALSQEAAAAVSDADTIIVTGTRRTDRTVADSPVPVDVISSEVLTRTGLTETARALRDAVPSFNFPQPSITDGTDVIRPATLRGLGPDQTLVLVNGKRRHASALLNINGSVGRGSQAVDINLIPSSALSRVEVLRDGAAAQYGSDAIAGVINFQLNDAREGGSVSVTYGQHVGNLPGVPEVTGLVTVNGVPQLTPDGVLQLTDTGSNRSTNDGGVVTVTGNIGLPLGADGFVNVTAEYRDRDFTNRAGFDPRRQYNVAAVYDSREFTVDRLNHRYGDAKTEDINLFVNAGIVLDDWVEAYAFASYGERDGESAGFFRRPNDNRNVLAIYPDGFLPLITSRLKDYALTGGLKGDFFGWNWDLSMQYGRNQFDYTIINSLNASLGAASPTEFDSGGLVYSQWVNNLDVSRDVEVGFLESLTVSGGLEYRRETFQVRAGELASYQAGTVRVGTNNPQFTGTAGTAFAAPGAQVFPGFQPTIGGVSVTGENARENFSVYAELDMDVIERWNIQLAGRFEDYSDFGSDWNWKAATRFEIVDGLAVRGAVSTGFRAPGLAQQFFAAAATNNIGGVLVDAVTLPVDNPVAQSLGSVPLKPETSVSWSAGLVFNAIPRLSLTVDYYQIEIDDRIVLTDNLTATRDAAGNPSGTNPGRGVAQILNDAGFNNISAARFFFNGIDTRTKGLDAIATYRIELGAAGNLGLTAGYNWTQTSIVGRQDTPGALNQVPGIVLFGRLESLRIERGQPRDKLNLGLDWELDWLGVTARTNRYGSVLAPGADAFNDVWLSPKWVTDLEARVQPWGGLELAIGANNIFNTYPTKNPTGQGVDPVTGATRNYSVNNYFLPYSSFSPFGFNGRFVYGRVAYRF
jgi:iron complex outermembrane recepter protein